MDLFPGTAEGAIMSVRRGWSYSDGKIGTPPRGWRRRLIRVSALTAVSLLTPLIISSSPVAAVGPVSVSPDTGLGWTDTVNVMLTGLNPNTDYAVQQCRESSGVCDPTTNLAAHTDGDGNFGPQAFAVKRLILDDGTSAVDCLMEGCIIAALDGGEATPPSAPIQFATPPPPEAQLSAMPNMGLSDGAGISVSGWNLQAGTAYSIQECSGPSLGSATCDTSTGVGATTDASGVLAQFTYHVKKSITVTSGAVDCSIAACVLAALGGPETTPPSVSIGFAGPLPTGQLFVSPNINLTDGTLVNVSGQNLAHGTHYSLEQCSTTPRGCAGPYSVPVTTDSYGNFVATSFTVHTPITVSGTSVDCTSAGACAIVAVGGPETNPPSTLLVFGTPPPPDPLRGLTVSKTLDPDNPQAPVELADLQPVYVSGGGGPLMQPDHDYGLAECVGTTCDLKPVTVHTDVAGFLAGARFEVHPTINDQTNVCLTTQCFIVVLDSTGQPVTHQVPFSFAGSPVGPPTLRGRVTLTPLPDGKSPSGMWGVAACLGGPGCAHPVLASTPGGSSYQFLDLTAGQSWDLAAFQVDSSGLHISDHFVVTPAAGQVITRNFVIPGVMMPRGEFVTGTVLDGDPINPKPLKADPFGGPAGFPLTGVLACPGTQHYGDPGCSGVNVTTTPTDAAGHYSLWLPVPAGQSSATWSIVGFTFFNAPPSGRLTSAAYTTLVIHPDVDPTVDFIVPVAPTLTYTGPTAVVNGDSVVLSGTARTMDGAPLADQRLTLGLGAQSCVGWTDPTVGRATCTITVAQTAGPVVGSVMFTTDPTYRPSDPVQGSVRDRQTIAFGALANRTFGAAPFTVVATASSGLAVTFTTTTPSVCTSSGTNGSKITIIGGGICTVQADQPGNATFASAPDVQRTFTVARVNQWILFLPLAHRTMVQSPFTALALATSGLPVSFTTTTPSVCTAGGPNGRTVTLVGAGLCNVVARQAGNGNYNPAPDVAWSFRVSKASQAITFGSLSNRKLAQSPFVVPAKSSSGLPVTFTASPTSVCTVSGTTVTLHHTGTCTITAHQGGNGTWAPAVDVSRTFKVT